MLNGKRTKEKCNGKRHNEKCVENEEEDSLTVINRHTHEERREVKAGKTRNRKKEVY